MMAAEPSALPLPEDLHAEVLRRLPPHLLAASRRVCRAWRDLVDARLRGHLLSRSVRGIFLNYAEHDFSEFFSRPSTGPAIYGGLDFLPPCDGLKVMDHCNGLLLCVDANEERDYVVNPATRRWARLPRRPRPHKRGLFRERAAYLAFDPAVSPHYEVFLIPLLPIVPRSRQSDDNASLRSQWPRRLHVFSSKARRWDERTFLREVEAAGIPANMNSDPWYGQHHAVYSGTALYIHCQHGCLTRISLSNLTYRLIRLPGADEPGGYPSHYLGRSLRGVYCAKNHSSFGLQLWHLDEYRGRTEWVLAHDIDLEPFARKFHAHAQQTRGRQWILQDVNYRKSLEDYAAPVPEEKYDWNSDEDNVLDLEDAAAAEAGNYDDGDYYLRSPYYVLGFHPYKEIVYLSLSSMGRGVAYDWNSSKFQDLGSLDHKYHYYYMDEGTEASFTYTPCWMGRFPGNELECRLEDEKIARRELKLQLESQLEDDLNSTYTCEDEYELRKFRGQAKRAKDSATKIRRRPPCRG